MALSEGNQQVLTEAKALFEKRLSKNEEQEDELIEKREVLEQTLKSLAQDAPERRTLEQRHAEVSQQLSENYATRVSLTSDFVSLHEKLDPDISASHQASPKSVESESEIVGVLQGKLDGVSSPTSNEPTSAREYSPSLSTHITRDNWTTKDTLGYEGYAHAIAAFLTHEKSKPPVTISIQAHWGGGKTSLMRMVQRILDPKANRLAERDRKESTSSPLASASPDLASGEGPGLTVGVLDEEVDKRLKGQEEELPDVAVTNTKNNRVTVWFNAWKYESMNQVWSGLVDAILQQVPSRLTRAQQELFWLRLNLSRLNSATIRQKLHNYFIHRLVRTTAGLGWALLAGASAAIAIPVLEGFGVSVVQNLAAAVGTPGLATAAFILVLAAAKTAAVHFKVKNEPISEVLNELVEVPKYESELGFVHQVEKDIKRVFNCLPNGTGLVIFIDDLDRCSPPKVASVLEAINLFLAGDFRECSFVIGMDSEMVAGALQTAHKDLAATLPSEAKVPIGWRFMDKFVQLPFVIPPVNPAAQKAYLYDLLGEPSQAHSTSKERSDSESTENLRTSSKEFREAVEAAGAFDDNNPEYRSLVLEAMPLFNNPRELKIFLNLFRFNQLIWYARERNHQATPSKQALSHWTAMSVKWPEHVRWLKRTVPREIQSTDLSEKGQQLWYPSSTLRMLEVLAGQSGSVDEWSEKLKSLYSPQDSAPAWMSEDALFRMYKSGPVLSEYCGSGFW